MSEIAPPAAVETPAPTKPPRERKQKTKKVSPEIYKFFQVKTGTVTRLRKECPRCGRGVYLAEHKDRLTCGKCGYTSYRKPKA
jgi:ubiquitin-small subunit ribosomal protein S27Ae